MFYVMRKNKTETELINNKQTATCVAMKHNGESVTQNKYNNIDNISFRNIISDHKCKLKSIIIHRNILT